MSHITHIIIQFSVRWKVFSAFTFTFIHLADTFIQNDLYTWIREHFSANPSVKNESRFYIYDDIDVFSKTGEDISLRYRFICQSTINFRWLAKDEKKTWHWSISIKAHTSYCLNEENTHVIIVWLVFVSTNI